MEQLWNSSQIPVLIDFVIDFVIDLSIIHRDKNKHSENCMEAKVNIAVNIDSFLIFEVKANVCC